MSTTTETSEIRRELNALARRIEGIESRLTRNGDAISGDLDLAGRMADIREISGRFFPGTCDFRSEFDPEYPDDRYVVVNVEASGNPREIVDLTCQWHECIRALSAELSGKLRLSVTPI